MTLKERSPRPGKALGPPAIPDLFRIALFTDLTARSRTFKRRLTRWPDPDRRDLLDALNAELDGRFAIVTAAASRIFIGSGRPRRRPRRGPRSGQTPRRPHGPVSPPATGIAEALAALRAFAEADRSLWWRTEAARWRFTIAAAPFGPGVPRTRPSTERESRPEDPRRRHGGRLVPRARIRARRSRRS